MAKAIPIQVHFIKFSEIAPLLGGAIYRNQLPQQVQDDLATVENADALIVGTPVYRASFTGLFKHFFDFVEQNALIDVPVLLAASGGSERHALVLEHQLRPLFSFSKHKPCLLVSMPQTAILVLNIPYKVNCLMSESIWPLPVQFQFCNGKQPNHSTL